jgi:hypothetical protein
MAASVQSVARREGRRRLLEDRGRLVCSPRPPSGGMSGLGLGQPYAMSSVGTLVCKAVSRPLVAFGAQTSWFAKFMSIFRSRANKISRLARPPAWLTRLTGLDFDPVQKARPARRSGPRMRQNRRPVISPAARRNAAPAGFLLPRPEKGVPAESCPPCYKRLASSKSNAMDDERRTEYLRLSGQPLRCATTSRGNRCDQPAGPRGLSPTAWVYAHRRVSCKFHRGKPAAQRLSED